MRLRLVVSPSAIQTTPTREIRLDLISVSTQSLTLRADWMYDKDQGDFKAYLEAAASVETYPAIEPWMGQIFGKNRQSPQPEYTLHPGQTLSAAWQTTGPHLKNAVLNPLEVQDPRFPLDGTYAVHVEVRIPTDQGTLLLRSNEQMVQVGTRRDVPQSTYGTILDADPQRLTATIDLGSLQKVKPGDRFQCLAGMRTRAPWKLTLTQVHDTFSVGTVEAGETNPVGVNLPVDPRPERYFPVRGEKARLVIPQ
jgi:hypothetical protein